MLFGDFRSVYLPYCIDRQEDGSWVILNREYKPVGFNTNDFINYKDYPISVKLKGVGPAMLKKLSYKGSVEGNRVYLYNDGCVPTHSKENMRIYLERLAILAKLKVVREK